ncbi:hypothetical protein Bca4012_025372 [Brassica carinata]|uniref:Uncharacterized protein n=1 Tax=Brassica carinata TaxID=52824 RepID=A0A8X8AT43_BRACI|nr:hypothetical protein Bca52824_022424 [Brassica carinata]
MRDNPEDLVVAIIMLERDTGIHVDLGLSPLQIVRAIHESFREMHGRDFGDRVISVTELKCECVAHT